MKLILIPAPAAAMATVALVVPASAASGDGQEFGHHVVHCAQAVGFDGAHNPACTGASAASTPTTCA